MSRSLLVLIGRFHNGVIREIATASMPILIALQVLLICSQSRSPGVSVYQNLMLLLILYANIGLRLPYRIAIGASFAMIIAHAASIFSTGAMPLAAGCLSSVILSLSAYITLAGNRRLERDERRHYLHTLRDRLRHERTEVEARSDPLTGLANRREMQRRLEQVWAAEALPMVGAIMLDIDHFKSYNDRYGHPAGDACLKRVANCIQAELRSADDVAARYGGEEMVVILPGADVRTASMVAERIRLRLESLGIPHEGNGANRVVTASFGVASTPIAVISADQLVATADAALYAAKREGRNRVFPPVIRPGVMLSPVVSIRPIPRAG
jgi:diguanylate cyclase (GGDEF)-like protein